MLWLRWERFSFKKGKCILCTSFAWLPFLLWVSLASLCHVLPLCTLVLSSWLVIIFYVSNSGMAVIKAILFGSFLWKLASPFFNCMMVIHWIFSVSIFLLYYRKYFCLTLTEFSLKFVRFNLNDLFFQFQLTSNNSTHLRVEPYYLSVCLWCLLIQFE